MAHSWSPDPNSLNQLIGLLRESQSNPQHQSGVSEKLDQFGTLPDYSNYLVYILTQVTTEEIPTRSISGLLLKNHIRLLFQNTPENQWASLTASLSYVQETIMPALSFQEAMLRRTATQVVAMILELVRPQNWPRGMETLALLIQSQNVHEAEGAFSTFAKLCEDIPKELEAAEIGGNLILDHLIPKFLQATEHPSDQIRVHALNCLNQFVQSGSLILQRHIDTFVQMLFKRASDENSNVRKFVCQALVYLLGQRPDKLQPEMNNVVEYMLYSTQDQDEEVALEACEFWLQFAEDPQLAESLRPYLDKVAPVLLKGMVYSEIDVLMLDVDEDDAAVPDRPEDIKPQFGASKQHRNERIEENGENPTNQTTGGKSRAAIEAETNKEEEEEENYDDESDYDEEDDSMVGEWNLRKCSAAALDVMALTFPEELLNILLPLLKERLFSADWLQRESGILALGAIAEGCIAGVQPHLPTLVPFLINCLSDAKPLVRSISCWTLGRYSSWCVSNRTPEHQTQYFIPTMEGLLHMALDNNKRVQEAGCSAFATLEEEAGSSLAPFLEPVLKNLVFAFEKYQQKNLLILYDAIGTLADSVGNELNRPEYVNLLMPPLIAKWQSIPDHDQALIPLLECLSSVTIAIGEGFWPYSPPVFQRCVSIVNNTLIQIQKEANLPEYEREAERTFVIVALDLLSGLTQGLASNVEELVRMSQPPLLPLLKMCITDTDASVRQSAYALLGDLAISVFPLLRPNLPEIMPELIHQIEPEPRIENISVCNNAAWCAGEIALQYGSSASASSSMNNGPSEADLELQKWIDPLIQRLVPVLLNPKTVKSLSENAAVTIGRLGLVAPNLVAPHLSLFIESWCEALWDIKDNEEKDSAFRGMCEMIQVNPNGAAKGFVYFCNAVVRWSTPSARLNDQFIKILTGFRDMSGDQWEVQKQQFPPVIVQRLAERYGL